MSPKKQTITKLCPTALLLAFSVLLLSGNVASAAASKNTSSGSSSSSQSSQSSQGVTTIATGDGSVQGYAATSVLQYGTIVQLAPKSTTSVVPATADNIHQMYGVVVDPQLLSLTITNASLLNETFVATSGTYAVLVSNQAGNIKSGDYVTLSAVDGVGMDAGTTDTVVFGRAVDSFNGKTDILGNAQLKDKAGQVIKNVAFGVIPVAINIGRNPDERSTEANLPKSLQRIGQAVAEKPVTGARIYLSVAISAMSVIIAIVMLYSGIRNALIAIGRNPLSKKTIFRGLLEVILSALLIVIVGLFAVYLLLKL